MKIETDGRVLRYDVWGGHHSEDHIARSHYALADQTVWLRSENDLIAGYLVNIRLLGPGDGWGSSEEFDLRVEGRKGLVQ
jgi:hypothetical protein